MYAKVYTEKKITVAIAPCDPPFAQALFTTEILLFNFDTKLHTKYNRLVRSSYKARQPLMDAMNKMQFALQ